MTATTRVRNAVILVLLLSTIGLQSALLYRHYHVTRSVQTALNQQIAPAPPNTTVSITGMPLQGNPRAHIAIVEFSDYQCPFCIQHANGVAFEITHAFVDSGEVKHVFANNPLDIHPSAQALARLALCAGNNGRYWEMHDNLFEHPLTTGEDMLGRAREIGLNPQAVAECLSTSAVAKRIRDDSDIAKTLKLAGTPAFAIGFDNGNNNVRVRVLITGARPFAVFDAAIRQVRVYAKSELTNTQ